MKIALKNPRLFPAAAPSPVEALKSPDARTRSWAVSELARINPPAVEAIPLLIKLMKKNPEGSMPSHTDALAHMGSAAIPALIEIFKIDDVNENSSNRALLMSENLRQAGIFELRDSSGMNSGWFLNINPGDRHHLRNRSQES